MIFEFFIECCQQDVTFKKNSERTTNHAAWLQSFRLHSNLNGTADLWVAGLAVDAADVAVGADLQVAVVSPGCAPAVLDDTQEW